MVTLELMWDLSFNTPLPPVPLTLSNMSVVRLCGFVYAVHVLSSLRIPVSALGLMAV